MPKHEANLSYVDHVNSRVLGDSYDGNVLLWDIDKTYLDTHFSSWHGLIRIPFEFAIDKRTVPGAVPVLRALRRGPGDESSIVPLYFVSGSPKQLRPVIERRMVFDGVDFDGITFKDQLRFLLKGKPRGITEQIGYKLTALLLYRRAIPDAAKWLMFGDDVESDATVFKLFGQICAGLRHADLMRRLRQLGVKSRDIETIWALSDPLPVTENPVERIFIHVSSGASPERFEQTGVVATRSYLQTILVLYGMGKVRRDSIGAVVRDLRQRGTTESVIESWIRDAESRLGVPDEHLSMAS